jgi:hypothetical protein
MVALTPRAVWDSELTYWRGAVRFMDFGSAGTRDPVNQLRVWYVKAWGIWHQWHILMLPHESAQRRYFTAYMTRLGRKRQAHGLSHRRDACDDL